MFQYDPEGFGEIPWVDFLKALKTPELQSHIPSNKRDVSQKLMRSFYIVYFNYINEFTIIFFFISFKVLLEKARQSKAPAITFQDFVNTVSDKIIFN